LHLVAREDDGALVQTGVLVRALVLLQFVGVDIAFGILNLDLQIKGTTPQ
jgi:hypothetical protein